MANAHASNKKSASLPKVINVDTSLHKSTLNLHPVTEEDVMA
jgi:hypothetical protein